MFFAAASDHEKEGEPCCMFSQESTFTLLQPGIYKKDLKGEKIS